MRKEFPIDFKNALRDAGCREVKLAQYRVVSAMDMKAPLNEMDPLTRFVAEALAENVPINHLTGETLFRIMRELEIEDCITHVIENRQYDITLQPGLTFTPNSLVSIARAVVTDVLQGSILSNISFSKEEIRVSMKIERGNGRELTVLSTLSLVDEEHTVLGPFHSILQRKN